MYLLTCFVSPVMGQEDSVDYLRFYRLVNEAKYACYHLDFQAAHQYYDQALALQLPGTPLREYVVNDARYGYAKVLAELGDTTRAIALLYQSGSGSFIGRDSVYFKDISVSTRKKILDDRMSKVRFVSEKKEIPDSLKHPVQRQVDAYVELFRKQNHCDYAIYHNEFDPIRRSEIRDSLLERSFQTGVEALNYLVQNNMGGTDDQGSWFVFARHIEAFLAGAGNWLEEHQDFIQRQIALGYLLPEDYYGMDSTLLPNPNQQVDCNHFFKQMNSLGLTPYFDPEAPDPQRGYIPAKSPCYETYYEQKYRYNCTDFNPNR